MYIYYTNKNFKIKKKIYLLNWKFSVILRRKNVCYYFCWSRGSVIFVEKIQFFLRFFWVSVCLFPPKQEVPLVCKGQKNKSSWRWTKNFFICCFFFFQNVFVTFFFLLSETVFNWSIRSIFSSCSYVQFPISILRI